MSFFKYKRIVILLIFSACYLLCFAYSEKNSNDYIELCNNEIFSAVNGTVKRISKNNNNLSSIEIEKDDGSIFFILNVHEICVKEEEKIIKGTLLGINAEENNKLTVLSVPLRNISFFINDDVFIIENQNFQAGFPVRACINSEVFKISYDSDDGIFILTETEDFSIKYTNLFKTSNSLCDITTVNSIQISENEIIGFVGNTGATINPKQRIEIVQKNKDENFVYILQEIEK
ncbi:MAG: hypothetical protein J6T84_05875 [Spirochaetaceae bacterium]|nr:hypothetical protein [Spirochaetaceae bacterium]